jgi:hypothetical protein
MRRVDRGLPADNETMRTSCWGLEKTEGYIKVKVKCWSAREGCPGERDFIIAEGDKTPRYVCSSCNESGYERGIRMSDALVRVINKELLREGHSDGV